MNDKKVSQSAKVQEILKKLDEITAANKQTEQSNTQPVDAKEQTQQQTVSDDFMTNKQQDEAIQGQESIIRQVLALFNVNYDDLIRLDGKSAYCQAVQFYPFLIDEVKKAPCPPLRALQIAKAMEPYIAFTNKYGTTMEQIRDSLKQEVKQENSAKTSVKAEVAKPVVQSAMFSDLESAVMQNNKQSNKVAQDDSLATMFNR